ncbi:MULTISPECIES: hypothetical protein [Parachlamydia]|jgi:hypothetical protein|uniref:Uncharacterized protein n=2 Tax=Parachlamydia acanthamoebae TaxID=83552 RepID=F8KXC8_PARAV|nr:hypothetical protein [Parachlamydia acanthamoebae]EFB41354.1 hypothetical protein pah_c045o059 [Parachlamydia acanthamoebae str. Hall's coccus]KIA78688.1 hypothetical protein DB43_DP00450 [Parachlamydia acanthamoebae]CCB85605.1 putative uncharacterized protein [Parachlamydia acanthamoebae UV-7]
MFQHLFIFQPGLWIGEGKLTFNTSSETLRFFTKWTVSSLVQDEIHTFQQVEMESVTEQMRNHFRFFDITPTSFSLELENETMGKVSGIGVIEQNKIAWEFRSDTLEGFEVYIFNPELEEYALHAEFSSSEDFRTIIDGKIWKKTT